MRLIVHCGLHKTGTTSLQRAFSTRRAVLAKAGILYPVSTVSPNTHHSLAALYRKDSELLPSLKALLGDTPEAMKRAAGRDWDAMKAEIAREKPETVILSSEMLFAHATPENLAHFVARLRETGAEPEAVIYLRQPSPYYLSMLQQRAKNWARVSAPRPVRIRREIEAFESAFAGRVTLRPFERVQLVDGDIVADFCTHALGGQVTAEMLNAKRRNESITAEAMAIVNAYRREKLAAHEGVPHREAQAVMARIGAIEEKAGRQAKPVLQSGIASAIDDASTDFLWLRDERGISFAGMDYSRIRPAFPDALRRLDRLEDIIEIDDKWRAELEAELARKPASPLRQRLRRLIGLRGG
ncbi:MAG: hypothetical protein KDJ74_03900 [Notoacmeibacter sp.]|nr:hypothetical protein [Notoacmeibacter sp.]